jgi:hypothetical protein
MVYEVHLNENSSDCHIAVVRDRQLSLHHTAEVFGAAMQLASMNDIDQRMLKESFRVGRAMQLRLL